MKTKLSTHVGTDHSGIANKVTTELYKENEYGVMEVEDNDGRTAVRFRNVGDRNADSAIQFTIETYRRATNRSKLVSFSVPHSMVNQFIELLQNQKP